MASAFSRTLRSIDADRMRAPKSLVVFALVIAALWTGWATMSKAPVYVVSKEARVESQQAVAPVEVTEPGRVVKTYLSLGLRVKEGDVLVELDPSLEIQRMIEQQTKIDTIQARIEVLKEQSGVREEISKWQEKVAQAQAAVAAARSKAAAASLEREKKMLSMSDRLSKEQLQSAMEHLAAQNQAGARNDTLEAARAEASQSAIATGLESRRTVLQISEVKRSIVELEGERRLAESTLALLKAQLERRTVRAPASGILGNVSTLQVGAVVGPGKPLATVVPTTDLRVIGYYPAGDSVGRVRENQPVSYRFTGFVWTQFGIGKGRVTRVANEPSNGLVRVEMSIDPSSVPSIPLQHGLALSAEVEIENITPSTYLVRTLAGGVQGPPGGKPSAAAPEGSAAASPPPSP
ncbi:MAG: HlyD family efflux transporter periplasmic adaptor subunit [Polyangiaceae bacterium]